MAHQSGPPASARATSTHSTSRKANAAGFAKRQSRKVKARAGLVDVYDFHHDKAHRQNVRLDLSRDEAAGYGPHGDEDESDSADREGPPKVRLVGDKDDDDRIASDEDEEIDSDAAFEETDNDEFAGSNFVRKTKKPSKSTKTKKPKSTVRFAEVDLKEDDDDDRIGGQKPAGPSGSEGESDEEEGDPEEFIDVLDVLDGRGEAYDPDAPPSAPGESSAQSRAEYADILMRDEAEDEEEEDEEGLDEPEDQGLMSGSDDDNPEALDSLEKFVSTLDTRAKRKAPTEVGYPSTERPRKRRLLRDRTEAGPEHEFGVRASESSKLELSDLLAPLTSQSSALQSLKSSTKALTGSKSKALDAPLPQRTQERLDRSAAYEQTKEEVDKWKATMKRIKEAEHLSFPLQAPSIPKTSNLELAAKFQPMTQLESSVDRLLKAAKMRDEDIQRTEELKMNHLSVEEVAERRGELRKMRDLMFRADLKAKRVARIKSKAYRKIHRKGKGEEGEDDDGEEGQMRREVERAKERATLRHKNTGKWAKGMSGRGELDMDQRREISDMLERGERLRRKIQGKGSEGGSEDDDDDEEDDEELDEDGLKRVKARAFEEMAALDQQDGPDESEYGKRSVFAMKFMKDAAARSTEQTNMLVADFVREMGGVVGSHGGLEDGADADAFGALAVQRTGGRVVYRPGTAVVPSSTQSSPPVTEVLAHSVGASVTRTVPSRALSASEDEPPSPSASNSKPNPWLTQADASSSKVSRKKNELVVSKDSSAADVSKNKLKKSGRKLVEERIREQEDAEVEITMDDVLTLPNPATSDVFLDGGPAPIKKKPKKPKKAKKDKASQASVAEKGDGDHEDDPDRDSEVEEQEAALQHAAKGKGKGVRAFEQRDLVALAFAGENVVQAFNDAKQREIAEDAPREEDTTLAGWGSWGGQGTKRQAPKPHLIKIIAGIDASHRADFGKAHVIISEKKDKKATKYLVKDLPFPYTSKAQFERSIDSPIGPEWNTRVGFQRDTLPKVVKKMGAVIMPLEKLHT